MTLWEKLFDKIKHFGSVANNEKSMTVGDVQDNYVYPCSEDNCLVRMACTKPCDKLEMNEDKIMDLFLKLNACPDCGSDQFMEGPSGGMATNVKCLGCNHWFNLGLPLFIQRIHIRGGRFRQ